MRGETSCSHSMFGQFSYFNPLAPCGARQSVLEHEQHAFLISIHSPRAGRDFKKLVSSANYNRISIHSPRAGRDRGSPTRTPGRCDFNPLAPCGARRTLSLHREERNYISIHSPRAGRDRRGHQGRPPAIPISIHSPRAGRDRRGSPYDRRVYDFNPLAPCGARPFETQYS